jgi:hypothetical protein
MHFYNKETFFYKQKNHKKYGQFNQEAAEAAYRKQCSLLKKEPVKAGTFRSKINRMRKTMKSKKMKKLTKKYLGSDIVITRAYKTAQKHAKIKSALANGFRTMNAETAIYQATALGPGCLSKLDRQRMSQTREAKQGSKSIGFDRQPDDDSVGEKKHRRKLKRIADYAPGKRIPGLRSNRTTLGRGTPAHASTPDQDSVSSMIRHRVEGNRAEVWTSKDGVVGISINAEDGMIDF